ncbi:hypothetical protein [Desulfovibrio sp. TomC]|uniref:hypothetical protein n=1 Tax=Desulfovibrio sp. TomC TaxID=1562888 RepID=UPI0012E32B6F|nr:hypothetical protein [Desulfovibrio sp. TomC]
MARLRCIIVLIFCLCFGVSCSNDSYKECDLTPIHDNFCEVQWGESYDNISKKFILIRTRFGGNDKEPGYQVIDGLPRNIEGIPVDIFFQFVDNKLNVVHIYAKNINKKSLMSSFYAKYGKPIALPSNNTAVWQDSTSSMTLQKELMDEGCLFSLVNNANYMLLTGRMMRKY